MNEQSETQWQRQVAETAASFPFPPTPDIAGQVRQRLAARAPPSSRTWRLAWAVVILLLCLGGLLAVPQVRAAVVEVLRIGAVRIFLVPPTATAVAPTATPPPNPTATPPRLNEALSEIAGLTTLAEAQEQVPFPIRQPTYPATLGPPDQVFLQQSYATDVPVVVLLWLDPAQPQEVQIALYQIGSQEYVYGKLTTFVTETTVNDHTAVWVEGPHLLLLQDGDRQPRTFVAGNVLLWTEGEVTYRLESGLSLPEAVLVAESLGE